MYTYLIWLNDTTNESKQYILFKITEVARYNHSFQTRYPGASLFSQCQTFHALLFLHFCLTFSLSLENKYYKLHNNNLTSLPSVADIADFDEIHHHNAPVQNKIKSET